MKEIFVASAVRTAIGAFGGTLKDMAPSDLGAIVAREAIKRGGVSADAIGHSIFGQVVPTGPRDSFLARVIAIGAGVPVTSPALTVNRLCGSGLEAVVLAFQCLQMGDAEVALAGGAETMSLVPFHMPSGRWGRKLGDAVLVDALNGALTDPFNNVLMGITAENVAALHGISRQDQDLAALESHHRAAKAIKEGRFIEQIIPVEIQKRGKTIAFKTDEHVRHDINLEELRALRTAFKTDGTVTAGNASGINDGAAALVLATSDAVKRHHLTPIARVVSYGHAGVEPLLMGMGPVPATQLALKRAGLSVKDLDVIESNEAFAAQACAVARALDFDPAKVNPNGSGISLGHPVGATGAMLAVKLFHELRRIKGRYGLVTLCIGGGQGIAAVFERC